MKKPDIALVLWMTVFLSTVTIAACTKQEVPISNIEGNGNVVMVVADEIPQVRHLQFIDYHEAGMRCAVAESYSYGNIAVSCVSFDALPLGKRP